MTERRYAAIAGTGSALPDNLVPNAYFESSIETSDEWIVDRTGIRARRFAVEGQTTADLAAEAAGRALESAGMSAQQVDLLVVATCTPDRPLPATASFVQARMGMACPALDINAACAGFSYATSLATGMIVSGQSETVLVVGAEVLSRKLDFTDRTTCVLFGDGAGAAVMVPSEVPGVLASSLAADGKLANLLTIPAGGTEHPATPEDVLAREDKIHMSSGRDVFKQAVVSMTNACRELLDKAGVTSDEVDLLIPHQANARIIKAVAERLGFGPDRAVLDIEDIGNTSAASIPIALDRAWRAGRIQPGALVLMTSFGAGMAWGATLLRWTAPGVAAV
ncbi:MAG: ketoacyl-ACP synthase III [Actinomycetota bacterium]|nr:ketoacyl-ACP synthase III [Actinomycetota bacterium]